MHSTEVDTPLYWSIHLYKRICLERVCKLIPLSDTQGDREREMETDSSMTFSIEHVLRVRDHRSKNVSIRPQEAV